MSSPVVIAVLALAVLAQAEAGPAGVAAAVTETELATAASAHALLERAPCYVSAAVELARFVADIPRNCIDLGLRSHDFLHVFPSCVCYSAVATAQLSGLLFGRCHS